MIKIERITNIEFSKVVTLHTSPQLRARYASVNSSCAHPPPPGNCGAFACLVSPGGGALANLAWPGVGHLPTPGLLTHMWFPTRNPIMKDFIAKDQQVVADWIVCQGLGKLVDRRFCRFYAFLHCLSRHNYPLI